MRRLAIVMLALGLAGCGAAGAPFTPTANLGLSLGSNGITPSASLGATNGVFSVGANL